MGWRVDWAVGWGSPEKKLGAGGPRGMAGAATDRRRGVVSGRAGQRGGGGRPRAAGLAAQGVEFDDKLQSLDFVSNGWKM